MKNISVKIRRHETPFFAFLYGIALKLRRLNMPHSVLPFYKGLYVFREILIRLGRRLSVFFYYEPLFRSQCTRVGSNLHYLKTRQGFPFFHGPIRIYLGNNVTIHGRSAFTAGSLMESPSFTVGDNTSLGPGLSISVVNKITIGASCLIGSNVSISDNDGHPVDPRKRARGDFLKPEDAYPVNIGDHVWIGEGVSILKGVTIGEGSVVGARSVVMRDIASFTVAAGNPAKSIKRLEFQSRGREA